MVYQDFRTEFHNPTRAGPAGRIRTATPPVALLSPIINTKGDVDSTMNSGDCFSWGGGPKWWAGVVPPISAKRTN